MYITCGPLKHHDLGLPDGLIPTPLANLGFPLGGTSLGAFLPSVLDTSLGHMRLKTSASLSEKFQDLPGSTPGSRRGVVTDLGLYNVATSCPMRAPAADACCRGLEQKG
jgi:hypothetical protein